MKLSQPHSARAINTARVLSVLRTGSNLSKAELSRILNLNKVSIGEIVDDLLEEGLVHESGKMDVTTGRKPTCIEIVPDAHYVLGVDIGSRFLTVALCDLFGNAIKLERIPTNTKVPQVESFCADIIKSCIRVLKLVDQEKLLGVGVTIGGRISADCKIIESCPYLPWKNIPIAEAFDQLLHIDCTVCNSTEALIGAERIASSGTDLLRSNDPIIYIDWGDRINCALICDGKVAGCNSNFGHVKVSDIGLCYCGEIGCLEAVSSAWALTSDINARLKDLWMQMPVQSLEAMAKAIKMAIQFTGSTKAIIGGEGATITDYCLREIDKRCPDMTVLRSMLGEKAIIQSCSQVALDKYVYHSALLDQMKDIL